MGLGHTVRTSCTSEANDDHPADVPMTVHLMVDGLLLVQFVVWDQILIRPAKALGLPTITTVVPEAAAPRFVGQLPRERRW